MTHHHDKPEISDEEKARILQERLQLGFNLIPFNPFPESGLRRSSSAQVTAFAKILSHAGIVTTVRKTRGDDIDAACGQLAGDVQDRTRAAERMARRRTIEIKPL